MNAIAAHAAIAATYDSIPNPLLNLEQRIVSGLIPDVHGRVAVDVASGTGRWAKRLLWCGARVISVDLCPEMLRHAPRPAVIADAALIPLPDSFADVTIAAFALSYIGPCLEEMARITRRHGMIIVSDMHPEAARRGWTRISNETILYSLDSLGAPGLRRLDLVEAAFDELDLDMFVQAGKPELIPRVRNRPAVFAAKWIRQ